MDVLSIILKKKLCSTGSLSIFIVLCVLDIELSSWCNDAFGYFFLHFGSDKLQNDMQEKKMIYIISTNVHLINHNNFSLIILLVLYAANTGTFSVIDWLFNFFEITFFYSKWLKEAFLYTLTWNNKINPAKAVENKRLKKTINCESL